MLQFMKIFISINFTVICNCTKSGLQLNIIIGAIDSMICVIITHIKY